MKSPYPFQRDAIKFCLSRRGTLLALDMGCGKTCIACNTILQLLVMHPEWSRVLIVCPASIKQNWVVEWEEWKESFVIQTGHTIGIAEKNVFPDANVVVINYDILSKSDFEEQLYGRPWDIIVLDESQNQKNPTALRTRCVKRLKARRKMCLTGTPILNRPIELWTTLQWLAPEKWSNWKWFVHRYCDAKPGWGKSLDVSGASNLEELHRELASTIMLRLRKEDVLKDLPPRMRQLIVLPAPEKAKPLIDEERRIWSLRETVITELRAERDAAKIAHDEAGYRAAAAKLKSQFSAAMSALSKIRHELGLAKIPLAQHHIQDVLESTEKLVVFAHHKDVVGAIADHFSTYGALVIQGETPTHERFEIVEKFRTKPEHRMIVLSIRAAATGINGLQESCSNMVMLESDWTPGINNQAESRLHRNGQLNPVLIQHLVFDGSLDAKMVRRCIEKQDVIDRAIDGHAVSVPASGTAQPPKKDWTIIGRAMTTQQKQTAQAAIRHIAKLDADAARFANGQGFSKVDSRFGHILAAVLLPSDAQYALMREMANKYRGQLPPSLKLELQEA